MMVSAAPSRAKFVTEQRNTNCDQCSKQLAVSVHKMNRPVTRRTPLAMLSNVGKIA
jgi:hypothetical protein